jgi:GNAT superfamily N-acetyltransferase
MKPKSVPCISLWIRLLNKHTDLVLKTPWDSAVFGLETFEILDLTDEILEAVTRSTGHYTIKVKPLSNKESLHRHGFYYCDTLIEPFCRRERFIFHNHESVKVSQNVPLDNMLAICHSAFTMDRFHRDFSIDLESADRRYANWLRQLHSEGNVYGLMFGSDLAGFIGFSGGRLVLHALAQGFRGQGLAKYLWSAACREFFGQGHEELTSSISAANVAVLNLYASLGFRFRNPLDVYHRTVK